LKVKYILVHKKLDTTGRHAHYQAFRNEEYTVGRPTTREEEDQLIQDGFQFVRMTKNIENQSIGRGNEKAYRQRKNHYVAKINIQNRCSTQSTLFSLLV